MYRQTVRGRWSETRGVAIENQITSSIMNKKKKILLLTFDEKLIFSGYLTNGYKPYVYSRMCSIYRLIKPNICVPVFPNGNHEHATLVSFIVVNNVHKTDSLYYHINTMEKAEGLREITCFTKNYQIFSNVLSSKT